MTIEEAIKHCEEVANDRAGCCEDCAEEHRQLAEWLKELKAYKEQTDGDLISRIKDIIRNDTYLSEAQVIDLLRKIDELPSAEKTAEWIKSDSDENCYCSKCRGYWLECFTERMIYCPNCGAKMKGE